MQKLSGNIDIINNHLEKDLWTKLLSKLAKDDSSIIGYKIPKLGVAVNDIPTFFIRSRKLGIVVIEVISDRIEQFEDEFWQTSNGDDLYSRDYVLLDFINDIKNRLSKRKELYDRRNQEITVPIIPVLFFGLNKQEEISDNLLTKNAYTKETLGDFLKMFDDLENQIEDDIFSILNSVLDGTTPFNKRSKKKAVSKYETINDYIQKSLEVTFNLDEIQRSIAMQIPSGPQRIRGLAGTGKTVILCMKAALAHRDNKDFKILFLFNTQSMYNQIIKYVTDYYVNEAKDVPNWKNLEILHSWGGRTTRNGLYSKLCNNYGLAPKTFFDAKHSKDALEYIYKDLLVNIKDKLEPMYDMVLIDEAQDFSPPIFETIYHITKEPKRIIWAYDEFQTLKELKIKEPDELFGTKSSGKPNMPNSKLEGEYSGGIERDFVLPNSYRNPRLNLMVAHGIGLGLYTKYASIPMKDKKDWTSRGYQVEEPDKPVFEKNDKIKVFRPEQNSKNILESLLLQQKKDDKDLVKLITKTNIKDELNYVINGIVKLIKHENVEPEEIIVITLDTKNSKSELKYIRQGLIQNEIASCSPGFIETPDSFKEAGRVTLTTAYRAKGNEANVVFVINAQRAIEDTTYNARNALFVSITRSRGWCFISGNGKNVSVLKKEFDTVSNDYPHFNFIFPDEQDISRRLKIIKSDNKNLEKIDQDIDFILKDETLKALLIEKIKKDDELTNELGL